MSNIFWGALSSKTVKLKKSYSRFVVASVYSNCATVNVCPWLALPRVYHLNSPLGDSHAMHTALKRSVNHTAEELCVGMSLFSAYYPNPGLYSSKKLSLHLTNHFTKLPLMQQQNLLSDKRAYRNTRIFSVLKMRILTFTVDSTVYSSLLDCPYWSWSFQWRHEFAVANPGPSGEVPLNIRACPCIHTCGQVCHGWIEKNQK